MISSLEKQLKEIKQFVSDQKMKPEDPSAANRQAANRQRILDQLKAAEQTSSASEQDSDDDQMGVMRTQLFNQAVNDFQKAKYARNQNLNNFAKIVSHLQALGCAHAST